MCILGASVFDRCTRIPAQDEIVVSSDSGIIIWEQLIMN